MGIVVAAPGTPPGPPRSSPRVGPNGRVARRRYGASFRFN